MTDAQKNEADIQRDKIQAAEARLRLQTPRQAPSTPSGQALAVSSPPLAAAARQLANPATRRPARHRSRLELAASPRSKGRADKGMLTKEQTQSRVVDTFGKVLLQALGVKRQLYGKRIDSVKTLFQTIDQDNSGTMDVEEFTKAMKRLGLGLTEAQMIVLVDVLDEDKNGQIEVTELTSSIDGSLAKRLWERGLKAQLHRERGATLAAIMAESGPGPATTRPLPTHSEQLMATAERVRKATMIHRFRQQLGMLVKTRQRYDVESRGVRGPRRSLMTANPDVAASASTLEELLGHMSWMLREAKTEAELNDAELFGIASLETKTAVETAEQFKFTLPAGPFTAACRGLYKSVTTFLGVHSAGEFAKYVAAVLPKSNEGGMPGAHSQDEQGSVQHGFDDDETFVAQEKFLVIEVRRRTDVARAA